MSFSRELSCITQHVALKIKEQHVSLTKELTEIRLYQNCGTYCTFLSVILEESLTMPIQRIAACCLVGRVT